MTASILLFFFYTLIFYLILQGMNTVYQHYTQHLLYELSGYFFCYMTWKKSQMHFNLVKCGALWIYWRAIWFFPLISWCGEITYLIFIWMLTFLSVYKPNLIIMSFCLSLKFVSELSVFIFCLGYFKSVFISVVSCTFLFLCCSCWVWVSGLW